MQKSSNERKVLIDGSRLITEGMARAGADSFIGYPITPANLLYLYASRRMPLMLPAPDEITTLQWMSGLSATGRLPVTATSFPGFALMIESVNMAFMMELPMVIVVVQRLGPATGTATCGAQGDIALLRGMISGGHQLPVLCTSDFNDCWELSSRSVSLAAELRTPVVLLTSKEEVMTQKSFDLSLLESISPVKREFYNSNMPYQSYGVEGDEIAPPFLPVTTDKWQVRLNASTHDRNGILQHSNDEAIANTVRLDRKAAESLDSFTYYELDEQDGADTLVVSYGITASAARDAVRKARSKGRKVSLLVPKTILPLPDDYRMIMGKYQKVIIAEENINAQFADLVFGSAIPANIVTAGSAGKMITPSEILKEEDCV